GAGRGAPNLVLSNSEASIASAATVTLTGDATLTAASSSNSVAKALPAKGGASGGAFGLGLSIAVNVVVDTTQALINGNVVLLPAVQNVSLTANGGHTMTTYAENGAKTTTASGDAITPVIAVAVSLVSSKADFAAGAPTVLA